MKYYICEGIPEVKSGKYNALSKVRKDVEIILEELGFEKKFIPTKYGAQTNKLLKFKQFLDYKENYKIWKKSILDFKQGDIVLIQYPLINIILSFEKVMEELKKQGVTTILLVHDLDSIRYKKNIRRIKEDREAIPKASFIIAHNYKMKEKLKEMCKIEDEKIISLEIFDYIVENEINFKDRKKDEPIIIAGALHKEKAEYLKYLKNIKNVSFNLYGKGYEKNEEEENINYKGVYLPDELLNKLEGSFGLVWDGKSIMKRRRINWKIFKI